MDSDGWVRVAAAGAIAPGEGRVVEAGGRTLALFNVDGAYYAIDNTCSHRGGPLGDGDLEGTVVSCPWLGRLFPPMAARPRAWASPAIR